MKKAPRRSARAYLIESERNKYASDPGTDSDSDFERNDDDNVSIRSAPTDRILKSAGASKSWVKNDVDLEGLEPEELDELFWELLTDSYCSANASSPSDGEKLIKKPLQASSGVVVDGIRSQLTPICELLISLSSIIITAVRDAVAEACLSICNRLLSANVEQQRQWDVANRQLKSLGLQRTSKFDTVQRLLTLTGEALASTQSLAMNTIFTAVFVHRYKDTSEHVRALCIRHLGQWITINPRLVLKDEHLRYVGWMLSDHSNAVRREAVQVLCGIVKELHAPFLSYFVQRFTDRFVEVAVGDVDSNIALDMMGALRRMQQVGLLDEMEQQLMDRVDELVFDHTATLQCRQEALLFVMDHTEGFDDITGESMLADAGSTIGAKVSRRSSGSGLESRQRTARQLETLVEFVAHHLESLVRESGEGSPSPIQPIDVLYVGSELLVDAFQGLPAVGIIRDWSIILALLLKEEDGLITAPLDPALASIMLRILVASALRLQSDIKATAAARQLSEERNFRSSTDTFKGSKAGKRRQSSEEHDWQLLGEQLSHGLSRLLVRYRDDPGNLSQLVRLFSCDCMTRALESPQRGGLVKASLKAVADVFEAVSDELVLDELTKGLSLWTSAGGSLRSSSNETTEKLLTKSWANLTAALERLLPFSQGDNSDETEINSSRKRKTRGGSSASSTRSSEDILDSVADVRSAGTRILSLWKAIDCRKLITKQSKQSIELHTEDYFSRLIEVGDTCLSLGLGDSPLSQGLVSNDEYAPICFQSAYECMKCAFYILLWTLNDVFHKMAAMQSDEVKGRDWSLEEANSSVSISCVISLRDMFVDVMQTWMSLEVRALDEEGSPSCTFSLRRLKREAFRFIGDLRLLFQQGLSEYAVVRQLVWTPPQEIVAFMREVYDEEGKHLLLAAEKAEDSEYKDLSEKLYGELLHGLLYPLARPLLLKTSVLNRRQAAAIAFHWLDSSPDIQQMVRAFMMQLKDADVVKYLEVQMVSLKRAYSEHVISLLRTCDETDDHELALKCEEDSKIGLNSVLQLTKKMTQSLGVGKLSGEVLATMMKFFLEGFDFSMSEPHSLTFFAILSQYLRFLPTTLLSTLNDSLQKKSRSVNDNSTLSLLQFDSDNALIGSDNAALCDFLQLLQGSSRSRRVGGMGTNGVGTARVKQIITHSSPANKEERGGRSHAQHIDTNKKTLRHLQELSIAEESNREVLPELARRRRSEASEADKGRAAPTRKSARLSGIHPSGTDSGPSSNGSGRGRGSADRTSEASEDLPYSAPVSVDGDDVELGLPMIPSGMVFGLHIEDLDGGSDERSPTSTPFLGARSASSMNSKESPEFEVGDGDMFDDSQMNARRTRRRFR